MSGEYYRLSSKSNVDFRTLEERLTFLERMDIVAPQIPSDLKNRLLRRQGQELGEESIRQAIYEWGVQWNLTDEWIASDGVMVWGWGIPAVYDAIVVAPYEGEHALAMKEGRELGTVDPQLSLPIESGKFIFSHDGLDLQSHTISELKEFITVAFQRALDEYIADIRIRADQMSWMSWSRNRERNRGSTPKDNSSLAHFDWTVRFQCLNETHAEIAKSVGITTASVAEGVAGTIRRIGLTSRTQGRRGRPSKKM